MADPTGFASVGSGAAAAAAVLARTRAIIQGKNLERLEAQRAEYQGLLAQFRGTCRRCFDTGSVWGEGRYCDCARGAERLQAAQGRVVNRILERAGVPVEYASASLDQFPRRDLAEALENYARGWSGNRRQGLILSGPVGVGKSSLLVATLRRIVELEAARDLETPLRYRFSDTADWLTQLRGGQDDGTYDDVMELAQTWTLWTFDDLGRTNYTAWEQGQLWGAMKARHDHNRPLFATTNLLPDQLGERLSPAVLDRLKSSCLWVTVRGSSMRRAGQSLLF